jgi:macrolide-specific efflux system membrane fusion protein
MKPILATVSMVLLTFGSLPGRMETLTAQDGDDLIAESAQADLIRDILVPVREPGVLTKILVSEGDWVQAEQVLAELDRELSALEHQAAQLKLEVSDLKATDDVDQRFSAKSKEVAEATLARSQAAVDRYPKSITKTELDQLRLEMERASLSIEKAALDQELATVETELYETETSAAEIKLEQRTIRSPIEGMVVEILFQPGEWVSAGQTLARVIQLDRMRIKALLPSESIRQSFVGRRAVFVSAIDGREYEGTIHFVSPEILPGSNKVQFWFDVENPDRKLRRRETGIVRIPAQ